MYCIFGILVFDLKEKKTLEYEDFTWDELNESSLALVGAILVNSFYR